MLNNKYSDSVTFNLTLFNDNSIRKKLEILDKMETMFDDERNFIPDKYFDMIANMPLGATMEISIKILNNNTNEQKNKNSR